MATTLQFRRGTSQEAAAFTGAAGELFVDMDNNIVYLHDGSTAGGHRVTTIQDTDTNTYLASGAIEGSTLTLTMNDSSKVLVDVSTLSGGSTDLTAIDTDITPIFDEIYDIGSADTKFYDIYSKNINLSGGIITGNADGIVMDTTLVGQLLTSDNMITPDDISARTYASDKGWVVINGNLDVDGDLLQLPTVETVGEVPPLTTGIEGTVRFNKDITSFEGYDGTSWSSLSNNDIIIPEFTLEGNVNYNTIENLSLGSGTISSGYISTAIGRYTISSGSYSTAMGAYTTASDGYSTAMGGYTIASGYASTAMGASTTASGSYSTAMGYHSIAFSPYSTAMGYFATASGYASTAMGASTTANGSYSTAIGASTIASGNGSTTMGMNCETSTQYSLGIGYDTNDSISTTFNNQNLTILLNGQTGDGYFDGSADLGAADYAEYFEWEDGNTSNEDRAGYFVSFVQGKETIEIGNSDIVGIVSPVPAVVGDSAYHQWTEKYLKDEFGRYIWQDVEVQESDGFEIDENGNMVLDEDNKPIEKFKTIVMKSKMLNPDYDNSQVYIPREDRAEWEAIGLLGKLWVYTDDNTLVVGDKVDADINGKAIKGSTYRILKIKTGLVQVLFK